MSRCGILSILSIFKFYITHVEIFLHYRKNEQFRKGDMVYIAREHFNDTCPVARRHMRLFVGEACRVGFLCFRGGTV